MSKLKPIIEQSMTQYAGAVLQSRALIDVRDGLKPSARQIFYSMLLHKLVHKNPYKKTANAVGLAMADFYIHGDSSCEGVIMRAGQPFAMRYPLVEVKGNVGTLIESGNWAASRYTESRLSKVSDVLFTDINKDTIDEWRDSYDGTKQYPAVLPTKGFYNIVNGTSGIGIGMASSIPQYNIKELNEALIYLIDNPDCDFEDIYCAPDFATGAILYNENEVKESMKNGTGFACKLRSVAEFDSKDRCFIVTEIPYGVYTNTICKELEAITNDDENNPGIERFNDLTGETPLIKIYLTKKANPDKVLKYLYKNTSLQHYYGINFTMLDQGRYPKVFTWKEMLQAHIEHEREVYKRGFEFDLRKIEDRIHIIDGLLICLASIDEVVTVIKTSSSVAVASAELQKKFILTEPQAKAVLDMKLSRLARLEVNKLEKERGGLVEEAERIHAILENEELFKNEIKAGWRNTIKEFGDARRTRILNLTNDNEEPTEIRTLQVSLTNKNHIYTSESSTLYTQKRGGVGTKMKLDAGEYVIATKIIQTNEEILFFTQEGNYYHYPAGHLTIDEKLPIESFLQIHDWEHICNFCGLNKKTSKPYILFITKQGLIKKSELAEYNIKRGGSLKALSLIEGDEILSVLFVENEKIGILTEEGNFLMIETEDIRPLGRVTKGIKGIKLNADDTVVSAHIIPENTTTIVSISGGGLAKQTKKSEFSTQGKNTKGSRLQKLTDGDWMSDFKPIVNEKDILITSTRSSLKLKINDIPMLLRGAQGNKTIKLGAKDNVVAIS